MKTLMWFQISYLEFEKKLSYLEFENKKKTTHFKKQTTEWFIIKIHD